MLTPGRVFPALFITVFIAVFIGVLDRQRQNEMGRSVTAQWVRAAIYGSGWSVLVALSFEYIFLVRLP
jgi:hypothetical protein